MLIIGAKGFAKEVLEVLYKNQNCTDLVFFDNINKDVGGFLYEQFPILKSTKEALNYFDKRFRALIENE